MNADIIKRRIERNVKQAFADYQADAEVKTKFGDPVIGYISSPGVRTIIPSTSGVRAIP